MDRDTVRLLYGDSIDLGVCIIAQNLNVITLRGSARIDKLALVSAPDVFDQVLNQNGTQRDTIPQHARDTFDYIRDAMSPENEYPKAFPDILLNVRDLAVAEFYDPDDPDRLVDFASFGSDFIPNGHMLGIKVDLSQITFPKEKKEPAISRVDGNHRLSGVELFLDELDEPLTKDTLDVLPLVPYSLLVGLDWQQEGRLFKDVNDNQVGVKPADLASLEYRLTDRQQLRSDPSKLPLYLSVELTQPGRAFSGGLVFAGGARKGIKEQGIKPLININALRSALVVQIKAASVALDPYKDEPDEILDLIDNYWTAVKRLFPEAWDNKRDYILLQSIGLNGFADFGGKILKRAVEDGSATVQDFERYLAPVRATVSLHRDNFENIAGAGGATNVSRRLEAATSPAAVNMERIRQQLTRQREQRTTE